MTTTTTAAPLSFDSVVRIEFDFAVRTIKRAAVKFSTSSLTKGDDDGDGEEGSEVGLPPGSHHLGTLIQALVYELRGRKPHVGRELLQAVSHELVLYDHLKSPEFYEGLGACISNRQKMQFICMGMKDPSFDGDFVSVFADLVGSGLVSVKDSSLYTLRGPPYSLTVEEARRLVWELVENACDTVEEMVVMVRRMYHPSEEEESNACLSAILHTEFFADIARTSCTNKQEVRTTICTTFPAAEGVVDAWIKQQEEEEEEDGNSSLDSFVVSDREIDDEFDDDSDSEADTTASEGDGMMDGGEDEDSMSIDEDDEEPPVAAGETASQASGHGRLRKARDVPERRDSFDAPSPRGEETRSNSSNDGEHSSINDDDIKR